MQEYIQIATFNNYLEANMTLGLLKANGVDCHFRDEYIVTIDPFLNNAVGGIKLLVAPYEEERARSLIKEAEAQYLEENIPCPRCGEYGLIAEEKNDIPAGMLGRLKNMLLFGQTNIYKKIYRCTNCRVVLTELPAPRYDESQEHPE